MLARIACNMLRRDTVRWLLNNRVVITDYPVRPVAGWPGGNSHIRDVLDASAPDIRQSCDLLPGALAMANTLPDEHWNNQWFPTIDTIAHLSLFQRFRPRTYLEIGSGHSTVVARHATNSLELGCKIVSIDPAPRAEVERLCDVSIRKSFEHTATADYASLLGPGDMLFIDNSHSCYQGSDVTASLLELLPSLPSGVIVGVHDIFLPHDYPASLRKRFYTEQYLLAAFLIGAKPKVIFPAFHTLTENMMPEAVREFCVSRNKLMHGCTFWFYS